MGFFPSRRVEPSPLSINDGMVTSPSTNPSDQSVAQLIRSRFYGKGLMRRGKKSSQQNVAEYAPTLAAAGESPQIRTTSINLYKDSDGSQLSQSSQRHSTKCDEYRSSTDAITMTLAQRLNELATANAEGLLNDDEYRVLRQNLFERFASVSTIPTESPVVKAAGTSDSRRTLAVSRIDSSAMNSTRSPSLRIQTSTGSSMSKLFRRATGRTARKRSTEDQDEISVMSSSSRTSMSGPSIATSRNLERQASGSSLKTQHSRQNAPDLRSISSKRSRRSSVTTSDVGGSSRAARSLRGIEPPPSSFTARHLASHAVPSKSNEDRLRSVADIRAEIQFTEAEERRLLDAFNGLELSIPTRHRDYGTNALLRGHSEMLESTWTLVPEQLPFSSERSLGFVSRDVTGCAPALSRSTTIRRFDHPGPNVETEMDDICQGRAEVMERYRQRLNYLHARLKGAEIHERLMRK
ncbi:hypothetical protein DFH11DRAFT_1855470 [Phellopilus nigrolimitatus]|nr:hypothetical protein DFH11DRAFT_1855470 [Phellopilus nigrolimitatus]